MIVAVHPPEQQCTQRIAVHVAAKVVCTLCEERGCGNKEDRPISESPVISRVATPTCKIGAASTGDKTAHASTSAHRYSEEEYAAMFPPNNTRTEVAPNEHRESAAWLWMQDAIRQCTYEEG